MHAIAPNFARTIACWGEKLCLLLFRLPCSLLLQRLWGRSSPPACARYVRKPRFAVWRDDGRFERINHALVMADRKRVGAADCSYGFEISRAHQYNQQLMCTLGLRSQPSATKRYDIGAPPFQLA
jgi:hypothetical protein